MSGMSTLLKIANSGRTLQSHYDEQQCHETHRFTYQGKNESCGGSESEIFVCCSTMAKTISFF
jgi:hypothetical protein